MKEHDRREFEKRLENPEFHELYHQLLGLGLLIRHQLRPLTALMPKAHELREGKHTRPVLMVNPGQNPQEVVAKAGDLWPVRGEDDRQRWEEA